MAKVDIYYFSGTGNSLHVARELQKRIPESNLIPIVSLLNQGIIETSAETVGLVFPLHGLTLPVPVKKFLEKVDLKSARYLFAIATRGGTVCKAFTKIDKILKPQGKRLDSCFILNMASNDPKFKTYDEPQTEELAKLESEINRKLDSIQKMIINQETSREIDALGVSFPFIAPVNFLMERLVLFGMFIVEHTNMKNYFYSDAKCTGCGTCEKVCPSKKIKMAHQKPLWQKNFKCYFCYACLNYCPAQSVQIKSKPYMKSYTEKNGRYSHPYATANDIAGQKK